MVAKAMLLGIHHTMTRWMDCQNYPFSQICRINQAIYLLKDQTLLVVDSCHLRQDLVPDLDQETVQSPMIEDQDLAQQIDILDQTDDGLIPEAKVQGLGLAPLIIVGKDMKAALQEKEETVIEIPTKKAKTSPCQCSIL